MNALVKQAGVVAILALVVSVPALAGMTNCLAYISSQGDDTPLTGYLEGERTHTSTSTRSYTSSWSYKFFGGTFSFTNTDSETYSVGVYRMSDGSVQQLRCDTYQYV